jgi:hypothetical protein
MLNQRRIEPEEAPMPRAIAVPIRQKMVEMREQGKSYAEIGRELTQSSGSVRQICRRYQPGVKESLETGYSRCGRHGKRSEKRVLRSAIYLKRRHPKWGAGYIRMVLGQRWPKEALPSTRTMQRWFREAKVASKAPQAKQPRRARAREVHQCWQVDATSNQRLSDGSEVCWLSASDETSCALLEGTVFPLCLV